MDKEEKESAENKIRIRRHTMREIETDAKFHTDLV